MSLPPGYSIAPTDSKVDLQAFARLVLEYSKWLGVDLGFQAFEDEMASLPGCYSRPGGCILLLQHRPGPHKSSVAVGCVAVRPLHTNHSAQAAANSQPQSEQSTSPNGDHQEEQQQQQQQQQCVLLRTQQLEQEQPQSDSHAGPNRSSNSQCNAAAITAAGTPPEGEISSMCEMKRLWVTHDHKGKGLGKALAAAAVAAARGSGYRHMVLDTLESLTAANRLYEGLGFEHRSAYYHNPLPRVVYWQLQLS